jgi:hypothetical protein
MGRLRPTADRSLAFSKLALLCSAEMMPKSGRVSRADVGMNGGKVPWNHSCARICSRVGRASASASESVTARERLGGGIGSHWDHASIFP